MLSLSEKKLRLVKNDLFFVIPAGFNFNCVISNYRAPLADVMGQMGPYFGTEKSSLIAFLKHTEYYSAQLQDFTQAHVCFNIFLCVLVIVH